jgi:hypothetical protein
VTDAEALLGLIRQLPQLLDPAPVDVDVTDLQRRERDEVHLCFQCGGCATVALVASTVIGARWLDLCTECYRGLRRYFDEQ